MSSINFKDDVELQDWEAMLAELRGDNVDDMVKGLKADTWDRIRGLEFEELPHLGNEYAKTLLANLEAEMRQNVGQGFLIIETFINSTNTSISVNGNYIYGMDSWKKTLIELTGIDTLEGVIDGLMSDYSHIGSKTLTELHQEGRDAVIERYIPDEEALSKVTNLMGYEYLSPIIKWAYGAGFFIKAVIEEHIKPEYRHAEVVVEDFDLLVTIQVLIDGMDIFSYDATDEITTLSKHSEI